MPGPLILAGGAEFDERMAAADRVFLAATGRARIRLALLPTANDGHPDLAAANGVRHFRSLGVEAEAVMVTDAASAADPRHVEALASADAVYMAGGNPRHLHAVLDGSPAWKTVERRWREDGIAIGGSSAGAMALCAAMFVMGGWGEALGVVPASVTLPHFDRRDAAAAEQARTAVVERGYMGLGVDESTALVWTAAGWRAAGPGRVSVLAAAGIETYRNGEAPTGLPTPA